MKIFESEIRNFLNENNSIVKTHIKEEYRKSIFTSYYSFFDDFLYKYGVVSINICGFTDEENKFIPYVKFAKRNIFWEDEGFFKLSNRGVSENMAQKLMAKYLISKLSFLSFERLKNWSDEYLQE
ncbi:hypothetical protein ACILDV_08025 [Capnocytophaga canimorsus]|uniref:hypothetical protein n=1 Tax=Capnocytophaga canimorsus TaxID=28188 RepID=UPI0037CCDC0F